MRRLDEREDEALARGIPRHPYSTPTQAPRFTRGIFRRKRSHGRSLGRGFKAEASRQVLSEQRTPAALGFVREAKGGSLCRALRAVWLSHSGFSGALSPPRGRNSRSSIVSASAARSTSCGKIRTG